MKKYVLGIYIIITLIILFGLFTTYRERIFAEESAKDLLSQVTERHEVNIKNLQFSPNKLYTKQGAIITFTNKDLVSQIVAINNFTQTNELAQDESEKIIFEEPGIYNIKLKSYPYVQGQIVVE